MFRLQGIDKWRYEEETSSYDYELVGHRLAQLQTARELKDEAAMQFLLRTST